MKKLAIIVMAVAALAALSAQASEVRFDSKECTKKCTKALTEKAQDTAKEDGEGKPVKDDNKRPDSKVDRQAIKKECELICKGND